MQVTEIFHSLQGEGQHAGIPTTFVRTTGCHLRCSWCDSAYAFYGGKELSVDEIMEQIDQHPTQHVCFTGGEPLIQKEALAFVERCLEEGYHVVIETSGSLDLADYRDLKPREQLCLSVDIKCPSSQMQEENKLDELETLAEHDQVKAVIADEEDYDYAVDVITTHDIPCPVYVQPVWGTNETWLAERVLSDGLDVRLSMQLHKLLWGEKAGV